MSSRVVECVSCEVLRCQVLEGRGDRCPVSVYVAGVCLLLLSMLTAMLAANHLLSDNMTRQGLFGYDLQDGAMFDFIVVGGGTAGSVVATRLALAGRLVLLVEAGGDPPLLSKIPGVAFSLIGSSVDYYYKMEPNGMSCLSSRGGSCRFNGGKMIGGSSGLNQMMYTRGNPSDYDFGTINWRWQDIEPYFLKSERLHDLHLFSDYTRYHNSSGVVPVSYFGDSGNAWQTRIIKGFESLNFSYNEDINAASQIGVSKILGYTSAGKRVNVAESYLDLAGRNLKLLKNTKCVKVLIDENNIARGIVVMTQGRRQKITLYANKEVIISAGTVGSAQLLLLSGVGPADHLQELNIPIKTNLPVGVGLADHVTPIVYMRVDHDDKKSDSLQIITKFLQILRWMVTHSGPLATIGVTDVTAFLNTNCYDFNKKLLLNERADCELPTTQVIHAYMEKGLARIARRIYERVIPHIPQLTEQIVHENDQSSIIIITPVSLSPKSRGWVRLLSADPLQPPIIAPNYLENWQDVEEMVRAIRIVEDLTTTSMYRAHNASLLRFNLPGCPTPSGKEYWECYVRHVTFSASHATGTCSLGRVVDEELRVHGVRGLRVVDASVLPHPPRGNIAAAVIALAERAADFVNKDN